MYYNEFRRLEGQISETYMSYLTKMENDISTFPSNLWSFLRAKRRTIRIPDQLHDEGGNNFTDPAKIVDAFSNTFASAYTPASFTYPNVDSDINSSPH